MTAPAIRVAVVDDSAFMRIALRQMLGRIEGVEIVAEGRNGNDAVAIAAEHAPDLMTLDVLMPGMNGIEALARIMADHPCPVIMISTETLDGAETTMRALDLGAVDFIAKTTDLAKLDMAAIEHNLEGKVRYWSRQDRRSLRRAKPVERLLTREPVAPAGMPDLLVVAASTGGPRAVTELVCALLETCCPVLVAQHMPAGFTADFARHLAVRSGRHVVEAGEGLVLGPGLVAVMPGGANSEVARDETGRLVVLPSPDGSGAVHPSADVLMASVAALAGQAVGVVLTGMGDDGAQGAAAFARHGWPVLVQDPASCVVAGMPQAVIAGGSASEVLTLAAMARRLNGWLARDMEGETA